MYNFCFVQLQRRQQNFFIREAAKNVMAGPLSGQGGGIGPATKERDLFHEAREGEGGL